LIQLLSIDAKKSGVGMATISAWKTGVVSIDKNEKIK
jgi:hypothetical protein